MIDVCAKETITTLSKPISVSNHCLAVPTPSARAFTLQGVQISSELNFTPFRRRHHFL
jgi:hypothetical protein